MVGRERETGTCSSCVLVYGLNSCRRVYAALLLAFGSRKICFSLLEKGREREPLCFTGKEWFILLHFTSTHFLPKEMLSFLMNRAIQQFSVYLFTLDISVNPNTVL